MFGQMAELGLGLQGDLLSAPSGKSMALEAAKDGVVSVVKYPFEHPLSVVGLALPFALSLIPQRVFASESMQFGKPVSSTEKIGDLVKTLALPLILGSGNAYRAWSAVGRDSEGLQKQIDGKILEANDNASINSPEDLAWNILAGKFGLDPAASQEEREQYYPRINAGVLEQINDLAKQEFPKLPETVAKLTNDIKELSKKRNKIRSRGIWQVPFEFGQGFLVGCFGMALLQPDGAPTMLEKFYSSSDWVDQADNGLYLSGYVYALWTAARETWKLQHSAGSRGIVADEAKAGLKRMRQDAGEDVKENQRPKLNDKAKAMAGDPIAKVKMGMKNGSK